MEFYLKIKTIEKNQLEIPELINKILAKWNSLDGFNINLDTVREYINKLEDKTIVTIQMKQTKENKQSLKIVWENISQSNICAIEVPKRERERGLRQKNIWRNSGRKILKLDENYTPPNARNITKSKWDKQKENHQSSSYSNG